jgi:hypothetical protein
MPRIAFITFGVLRERGDHPAMQGFFDRSGAAFVRAEASHGHVDHYRGQSDQYRVSAEGCPFGAYATGRFVTADLAGREEQTLSLWADLEAVFAFAYGAVHAEALRHRTDWFLKPAWPTYVAWWVADDHWPDWREANARLEHLHDHGASPAAFDFRSPFDADGRRVSLDRGRVAALRDH